MGKTAMAGGAQGSQGFSGGQLAGIAGAAGLGGSALGALGSSGSGGLGRFFMGGQKRLDDINLLTPGQQQFLSGALGGPEMGQQAGAAYQQMLQPYDPKQYEDVFNRSIVDPAIQQYQRQILPSIQQRFVDANAGSSSALNQALTQSANDLTSQFGTQYGNFFQNQQQRQLGALQGLGGLATQQTFAPQIEQSQGILGPLNGDGGQVGAGYMISSEEVKENIRDYSKGLDIVSKLEVKMYDYIEKVGGQKDKVGVIAEKVPPEIQGEIDGIRAVDLYGLVGLLINSVKELNEKIVQLEGTCQHNHQ